MNSVLKQIKRTIGMFPDNVALDDDENEVTYAELGEKMTAAATKIIREFDSPSNTPVAVYLPKSVFSVISFMGVLASGNIYVPIDYNVPKYRLMVMLQNIEPLAVITDEKGRAALLDNGFSGSIIIYDDLVSESPDYDAVDKKINSVIDTDPAYIMYTSGSTGVPKGVVIAHRGIINYANWLIREFDINSESVLGLQSGFHFDNSVFDIYTSFFTGAKMVIIPEILFMYPQQLIEFVASKAVTCIFWVPTVMINTANAGVLDDEKLKSLKTVVFAGEVMPNAQLNIWRRALPGRVYANLYGPTEITVDCTYYIVDREFEDSDKLPIGVAVPNTRVLILGEDGHECAPGEEGELCVAGCCLALGYWNNPELTKKAFVQNPLNSKYRETIYKTGDIAYKTEEGIIMYSGRRDSQFKLRGNRIELGDIESACMCLDFITSACAMFDSANEKIVLVIESGEDINVKKLNMKLGKLIPQYMLPKELHILEKMPLTPNRKIDRKSLFERYVVNADA